MAELDPTGLGTPRPTTRPGPADPDSAIPPDRATFEDFYRTGIAALVAFLLYLGACPADAADGAQAAMIEAFRAWSTIRHPKAWVRTVASRAFLRRLSATEETPTPDVIEPSPLVPAPSQISEWEQRHEILRLIQLLPARQRQVMAWTFDGYTPTQIAELLDLDPAAVRQNLHKARAALTTHLKTEREEDTRDA